MIELLIDFLFLLFRSEKALSERSIFGQSDLDRSAIRLWKRVAQIGTLFILLTAAAVIGFVVKASLD